MRTTDEINAYLEAFKQKKLKEKEAEQLKKRQETKKRLREVYTAQRKALQEEKRKRAEELIKKLKIHQQKTLEQEPEETMNKFARWMKIKPKNNVGDFNEDTLYLTREELIEAEKRGEGKINWPVFDRMVEEFHKQMSIP